MPTGVYKRKRMSKKAKRAKAAAHGRWLYANSKEHREKQRDLKLRKAYGITLQDYNDLNEFGNKVCCICEKPCPSGRQLAVDHDHSNGVVRGLLCIKCNKGLGNFNDNIELLKAAIQYLEHYKEALLENDYAADSQQVETRVF